MTLSTPILSIINTFDPAIETQIKFSYSGGQIAKKRIVIKDADTLDIIYDNVQKGMQLSYILEAGILTPGKYVAQIQVTDYNDYSSDFSDSVLFYCYSTPVFEFVDLFNTLNRANITLSTNYYQAENDPIAELNYFLYDHDHTLVAQSSTYYSLKNHTFYGLKNLQAYFVRATVKSKNGMTADTGYVEIDVNYVTQPNNVILRLENHCDEGYIFIGCNIIDIGYVVGGNKDYIVKDGELTLRNDSWVTYNSGFEIEKDFSVFLKARQLPIDRPFFRMHAKDGDLVLTIRKMYGVYYCEMTVTGAIDSYYRYAAMPHTYLADTYGNLLEDEESNILGEATMSYQDSNSAVFEVKRYGRLYSLDVYYENNGTIVLE